jgi:hypothetical protein
MSFGTERQLAARASLVPEAERVAAWVGDRGIQKLDLSLSKGLVPSLKGRNGEATGDGRLDHDGAAGFAPTHWLGSCV